jgi:hypothetical protein
MTTGRINQVTLLSARHEKRARTQRTPPLLLTRRDDPEHDLTNVRCAPNRLRREVWYNDRKSQSFCSIPPKSEVIFGFLVAVLTDRIQNEATAKQAQRALHAASGSAQFGAGYDCRDQAQPLFP